MRSIIFDTETTGLPQKGAALDKQPHIIELGAIYIDHDGSIIRTLSQLLDPTIELPDPKMTLKISGIKPEDLIGKPTFAEYLPFLTEFFKDADALIAHNADFDTKILGFDLERRQQLEQKIDGVVRCTPLWFPFPWPKQTICTVQEYKHMMGKWPKMTELYEKIMGKPLEQTHRALDDCMALHEILVKDDFFGKVSGDPTQT